MSMFDYAFLGFQITKLDLCVCRFPNPFGVLHLVYKVTIKVYIVGMEYDRQCYYI